LRQLFILLFSLLITTNVSGEPYGYDFLSSSSEGHVFFVNTSSIKKDGDKSRIWTIRNIGLLDGVYEDDFKSYRALSEYDCKNDTYRILSLEAFDDIDATGKQETLRHPELSRIEYIVPYSLESLVLNIACK